MLSINQILALYVLWYNGRHPQNAQSCSRCGSSSFLLLFQLGISTGIAIYALALLHILFVDRGRVGLPTPSLQMKCSTTELTARINSPRSPKKKRARSKRAKAHFLRINYLRQKNPFRVNSVYVNCFLIKAAPRCEQDNYS